MKRQILNALAAAALAALAAGCAKEPQAAAPAGAEAEVSFTVSSPEIMTRAIADGNTVNKVACVVYDSEDGIVDGTAETPISQTVTMTNGKAEFKVRLVTGQTYSFLFWAYRDGASCYTLDEAAKTVKVSYENAASNDESRDAFYAYRKDVKISGEVSETVTLKRPFAQLNFGTTAEDVAAAKAAGIEVAKSSVKLTGLANELDLTSGSVSGSVDAEFTAANLPADTEKLNVKGTEYVYVATNYVLVGADQKTISNAELKIYKSGDDTNPVNTLKVPNVPLQGNYRTNVIGNLFTSALDYNIEVGPGFEDDDKDIDLENINCTEALVALFANGGSAKLAEDIELAAAVTIPAGIEAVLDLNGHNITNKGTAAAIFVNGNLTIDGEGTVDGGAGGDNRAIQSNAGGNLTINGGTYKVGADATGAGNSTIYSFGGNVTITGGTFSSAAKWSNRYWVINKKNGFTGAVKISGGKYFEFNPADPTTDDDDSYLADGYKSTKVGDYYIVTKADVTPVASQDSFNTATSVENANISLVPGIYTLPTSVANGVTIKGESLDAIIEANSAVTYSDKSVRFENLTYKNSSEDYIGLQHTASVAYSNCVIEGRPTMYATTATCDNCTFRQSTYDYCIWTYASKTISFNNCTFETVGKAVKIYHENTGAAASQTATFTGCTFKATDVPSGKGKAAIEIDGRLLAEGNSFNVIVNNCTATGFVAGETSGKTMWNADANSRAKVTVDGNVEYSQE